MLYNPYIYIYIYIHLACPDWRERANLEALLLLLVPILVPLLVLHWTFFGLATGKNRTVIRYGSDWTTSTRKLQR